MLSRLFAALFASVIVATTASPTSAGGSGGDHHYSHSPHRVLHARSHDYSHRYQSHGYDHGLRHHDGLDVHIANGFSFSIGTRSSRWLDRGHHWNHGWNHGWDHDWDHDWDHGGDYIHLHGRPGYRPHGFYYSSGYYDWPGYGRSARVPRVIVERPIVREVIREIPVYRDVQRDPSARHRTGWNALARGDLHKAREYFSDEAVYSPGDPVPKVGLALSRAGAGMDDQAEWAMRRAVRAGLKQARAQLPEDTLERLLSKLEVRYEERAYARHDSWFMVAAARYLKGDESGAASAAAKALKYDPGDDDARRIHVLARHQE